MEERQEQDWEMYLDVVRARLKMGYHGSAAELEALLRLLVDLTNE